MMRHLVRDRLVQAAATVLAMSIAVLVLVAAQAFRSVRIDAGTGQDVSTRIAKIMRADTTSDDLVDEALDHDPFAPTRTRPATRYGTPAVIALNAPPPPPPATLRLLGTVVEIDGASFALCQLGADQPHVVRVGQKIGGFLLRSISQGVATFTSAEGERVELRVPKTGS